ncbi:P-protein [Dactylellina cionopaga]|nr:P-protein [Dactylellina cionopaga]
MQSVAYLGPPSTYSHQVTLQRFPTDKYKHIPCIQISDIFASVESGKSDLGVVPFENSTNGSVVQTLDLFCDRNAQLPNIRVCSEAYLDVHHCLLGHPRDTISRDTVARIYSHPQAFGQCEPFLAKHLKGVERVDVSSTSKAADLANKDPSAVAIASAIAADVHPDLEILASNIEERSDNTTRFLVISKNTSTPSEPSAIEGSDKTFMTFTVHHEQPGALCDMLMVFKEFGMNLTSISSRPSLVVAWNYIFLVEFEGHEDSSHVKKALQKMNKYCRSMRVFGSYEKGLKKTG